MNLAVAILIVVAATGIAIMAMLWVRRKAPDGSYQGETWILDSPEGV